MATTVTVEQAMRHAVSLAYQGTGHVSPNPRVGCVLLHNNQLVGKGWHKQFGGPHAEIEALLSCPSVPQGTTLVVTLEPCSHTGKTPPCADAIIASGIRHVVVGCTDPNPLVAGRGIERLRATGITVDVGVCHEECTALIRTFATHITMGRPHVAVKLAQSIDGSITSFTRKSAWITGEASRTKVHALRAEFDAILVGVGTVIADDPQLTVRHVNLPSPRRFVLDPQLRTPLSCRLVTSANNIPTTIFTRPDCAANADAFRQAGVHIEPLPFVEGRANLTALLDFLHSCNVTSLLVEGGAATASAFLEDNVVDELHIHIAPILLGNSPRWFRLDVDEPAQAPRWHLAHTETVDSDVHLTYYRQAVKHASHS